MHYSTQSCFKKCNSLYNITAGFKDYDDANMILEVDRFIEFQRLGPAYEAPCNENHKYMEVMRNLSLFSV